MTVFTLQPDTQIEVRLGLQSVEKSWGKIAFEYIGAKSADLAEVSEELKAKGKSEWNGFLLIHPLFER